MKTPVKQSGSIRTTKSPGPVPDQVSSIRQAPGGKTAEVVQLALGQDVQPFPTRATGKPTNTPEGTKRRGWQDRYRAKAEQLGAKTGLTMVEEAFHAYGSKMSPEDAATKAFGKKK